jgi:hypothetical protein
MTHVRSLSEIDLFNEQSTTYKLLSVCEWAGRSSFHHHKPLPTEAVPWNGSLSAGGAPFPS